MGPLLPFFGVGRLLSNWLHTPLHTIFGHRLCWIPKAKAGHVLEHCFKTRVLKPVCLKFFEEENMFFNTVFRVLRFAMKKTGGNGWVVGGRCVAMVSVLLPM